MNGYDVSGTFHDFSNARLFAVAVDSDANWDYFVDYPWTDNPDQAAIWAVARLSSGGAKTCYFGGIDHIKKLMRNGMFNYVEFTELGRAIMGV